LKDIRINAARLVIAPRDCSDMAGSNVTPFHFCSDVATSKLD
jgi:hypothetical protein